MSNTDLNPNTWSEFQTICWCSWIFQHLLPPGSGSCWICWDGSHGFGVVGQRWGSGRLQTPTRMSAFLGDMLKLFWRFILIIIRWYLLDDDKPELRVFAGGHILTQQRFWPVKEEFRAPGDYWELAFTSGILLLLEITKYSKEKPIKTY